MRIAAPDFRACLAASAALHLGFFLFRGAHFPSVRDSGPVEIDLTSPFIGSGPPKLAAPKRLIPEAKLPARPVEEPLPEKVQPAPEPPKDWNLPGKDTKTVAPRPETPQVTQGGAVDGTGISPILGGQGAGFPYGVPNGSMTPGAPADVIRPKLLNREEVLANMRKFYPERERVANREGIVVVNIHLDADGRVGEVDIVQSAGRWFDEAAKKVAQLMKFSPARNPAGPLAAKVQRTMEFKLED